MAMCICNVYPTDHHMTSSMSMFIVILLLKVSVYSGFLLDILSILYFVYSCNIISSFHMIEMLFVMRPFSFQLLGLNPC